MTKQRSKPGRPRKLTPHQAIELTILWRTTEASQLELAESYGVSLATLKRYIKIGAKLIGKGGA